MSKDNFAFSAHKVSTITPLYDTILVSDMEFDNRTLNSGLILLNDNMKSQGIRPRWAKVFAIGPDQHDVNVGQWIMVSHGRWSRGINIEDENGEHTIRKVDNKDIMLISDTRVDDQTMSDKVY